MNTLGFSPDGTVIATGADDAKVKLWSASSGFCFATFADHAAPVSAVVFGPAAGRVVLSASLDGTVRAYDLLRCALTLALAHTHIHTRTHTHARQAPDTRTHAKPLNKHARNGLLQQSWSKTWTKHFCGIS